MAYTQESQMGAIIPKSTAIFTACDLTAGAGVYGGVLIGKQVRIKRIGVYVTTAIACSTANPQVQVKRRPTYNSSSGAIVLGTINVPTGTAAGTIVYNDISPTTLFPGDELSFERSIQGTDASSAAGAAFFLFEVEDDPEVAGNQSKMLATL